MSAVELDRILETLYKRGATDIMLVPGSPPVIRCRGDGWRMLQAPAMEEGDVRSMAAELLSVPDTWVKDDWTYTNFWYGKVMFCRVMGLGYPETRMLLVAHTAPPAPADVVTGLECEVCGAAATVHATEVREGKAVEAHLCAEHAAGVKPEGFD